MYAACVHTRRQQRTIFVSIILSPRPWGEGGHLDLLLFPITQMCVGVRPCPSVPDFVYTRYFLQFFTNGFQFLKYGDHGQDLESINVL